MMFVEEEERLLQSEVKVNHFLKIFSKINTYFFKILLIADINKQLNIRHKQAAEHSTNRQIYLCKYWPCLGLRRDLSSLSPEVNMSRNVS